MVGGENWFIAGPMYAAEPARGPHCGGGNKSSSEEREGARKETSLHETGVVS